MPRVLLAALLAALTTACGGGGGPRAGVTQDPTTSAPPTSAPPASSSPVIAPSPSVSVTAKHGSATVTYGGRSYNWAERACETTRGMDGKPVGWMATFQDVTEQDRRYQMGISTSKSYVQIRVRGGYTGAGTYASERVSLRLVDARGEGVLGTGFATTGQTFALSDEGRKGTYKSKDVTVELTCDPADDTSTKPGMPVAEAPAAGTAYVVRPEGAVFEFDGVRCEQASSEWRVTAGSFPHVVRVLTGRDGGGARVLFGVHGVVLAFNHPDATARIDGDGGTLRYSPGGPNATTDVTRGAWTCG